MMAEEDVKPKEKQTHLHKTKVANGWWGWCVGSYRYVKTHATKKQGHTKRTIVLFCCCRIFLLLHFVNFSSFATFATLIEFFFLVNFLLLVNAEN